MKSMIRLAWSYISAHRGQSIAMVVAVSLSLSLPLATVQMVNQYERQLLTRSGNPPLLLGPRGSWLPSFLKSSCTVIKPPPVETVLFSSEHL